MDDYIERKVALAELDDIGFCDDEPVQTRNRALQIIKKLQAADVRPVVHGKWDEYFNCSNCGESQPIIYAPYGGVHPDSENFIMYASNFCPNCGADMRDDS